MAIRRSDPLEINQVWTDNEQDYKPFRIVIDEQGDGGGSGSRAIEVVKDDVVVWSVDENGVQGGTGQGAVVASAATLVATAAEHAGRTVILSRAAGVTVTLPAATGSGAKYTFVVGTTVTSNNNIIQVVGNDIMQGVSWQTQDAADTVVAFEAAADSDTITCNGSTKGGLIGDKIELIDMAADTWMVHCLMRSTGTEATPFSAAVTP